MSKRNDFLKSLFLSAMIVVAGVMVVIWAVKLYEDPTIGTAGILISALGIVLGIASLFFLQVARTNLRAYSLLIFTGFIMTLYAFIKSSVPFQVFMTAIILMGFWLAYLFWYSKFGYRTSRSLRVGRLMPEFALYDVTGKWIDSKDFYGKPAIFIFYRGNWCPLCMAQINEMAANYHDLERLGVQTILISNQPHDKIRRLAARFEVDFHFLVDVEGVVAKEMDLFVKNGLPFGYQIFGYKSDTVLPTVIIVDPKGRIMFSHQTNNYRLRPKPALFIKVLREAGFDANPVVKV